MPHSHSHSEAPTASMSISDAKFWSNPKIAALYKVGEAITGRFARLLLLQALHDVDAMKKPLVVLDNACGTGVVSDHLWELLDDSTKEGMQLVCGDFSEAMVKHVKHKIEERRWKGAEAKIVDAMKTGLPDDHFTHVVTSFGIMLMPDPDAVLDECSRILKPDGVCALSTWDSVGWVPIIRAVFATLPGPPPFPDTETLMKSWGKGRWYSTEFVEEQLVAHGFVDVKVEIARNRTTVMNSKEFFEGFSMMLGQITSKFWSEQDKDRCEGLIEGAVIKYLNGKYGENGAFEIDWAAVLSTGRKPVG